MKKSFVLMAGLVGILALVSPAHAAIVDSGSINLIDNGTDIKPFPTPTPTGSGLGTLDIILFEHGSGGAGNSAGPGGSLYNGDNANTDMASGATASTNESWITSIGDLRRFYVLNFPNTATVDPNDSLLNQIVLFLNINETGGLKDIQLDALDIVQTYSIPTGSAQQNPNTNDITSAQQNAIGDSYLAGTGTRIAKLGAVVASLPQIQTGIGGTDYYILTGINPFDPSFSDSTRLLFHWASSAQEAGGEVVYLSGTFRAEDFCVGENCNPPPPGNPVPEPSSMLLVGTGLAGLVARRLRKKIA